MPERLGPGSMFAGCRLETVAGRGGMGVVYRATQLALQRPVALKAMAPELAEDPVYRERFERESHLAASIDHPNVIPVYEAGEADGTLYLIMRWVPGTDLRAMLASEGKLSPGRALRLLRPVAGALAAAHRRGLVHRDIKPANVLIAREDAHDEEHVYLTDFGIARRTDAESITRTGLFVGTVDYTAPERIQGGRGGGTSDIYSLGCMLFETLTGHVPFDRPTDISKIFAHVNDPVPSARAEVAGLPEQVDTIVAKAMAKDPAERFASAGELAAALGQAIAQLDTVERRTATRIRPRPEDEASRVRERTPPPPPPEPLPTPPMPTAVMPPAETGSAEPPSRLRRQRRLPVILAAVAATVAVAVALVVLLAGGGGSSTKIHGSGSSTNGAASGASTKIHASGLSLGQSYSLGSRPAAITIGLSGRVWVALPDRGSVVRIDPTRAQTKSFRTGKAPTVLAAAASGILVGDSATHSVALIDANTGKSLGSKQAGGSPTALAVDPKDGSVWVADSSATLTHVDASGNVIGSPIRVSAPAKELGVGEGWLWVVDGAAPGLIRASRSGSSAGTGVDVGPAIGVTFDSGVWVAGSGGRVTRVDPRPSQPRSNGQTTVAPDLDGIAAVERGPYVWAISASAKALYRITNASRPAAERAVTFASPPVALAVIGGSVWVATADGKVTQIAY